jgi:hypothetical protein
LQKVTEVQHPKPLVPLVLPSKPLPADEHAVAGTAAAVVAATAAAATATAAAAGGAGAADLTSQHVQNVPLAATYGAPQAATSDDDVMQVGPYSVPLEAFMDVIAATGAVACS